MVSTRSKPTRTAPSTDAAASTVAPMYPPTQHDGEDMSDVPQDPPRTSFVSATISGPRTCDEAIARRRVANSSDLVGDASLDNENEQPPSLEHGDGRTIAAAAAPVLEPSPPAAPATTRGRTQTQTPTAPPRGTGPWDFQATEARAAAAVRKAKDVGYHRPSMAELKPLLAKHAAGTLSFEGDILPLQNHSPRPVVGWLTMATGHHTKNIDEASAMKSLLHDNQQLPIGDVLVDVIKFEKDLPNRMVRWGIATTSAIDALQGVSLRLRIGRDGTTASFLMAIPHALDGFSMDLPDGLRDQSEERLMFEILARLEPRFLWGSYTNVSATTGLAGSRYRLHFLGDTVPTTLLRDGRMIEELIFKGRRLKAYGRGWYYQDKHSVRLDLDVLARSYGLMGSNTPQPKHPKPTTAPKSTKKAKVSKPDQPQWTEVHSKKGPAKSASASNSKNTPHEHSWVSPNMFAALDERVSLKSTVGNVSHGPTSMVTILPVTQPMEDEANHLHGTTNHRVCCAKIDQGTPIQVDLSLDAILAELAELDVKAKLAPMHLQAQVEAASTSSQFNLAKLVLDGRVDTICSNLERYPIDFGVQLHRLFAQDRPTFEYFMHQRLLHRWLRATWGGSKSFDQLYSAAFGMNITMDHVLELFSKTELVAGLEPVATLRDGDDEIELDRIEVEEVLALAEVLLAVHATLYYNSDAALLVSTRYPTAVLAPYQGSRCLSSETIASVLLYTDVGQSVWDIMTALYVSHDDSGMQHTMKMLWQAHNLHQVDITVHNQVMVDPSAPRLVHADLTAPGDTRDRC